MLQNMLEYYTILNETITYDSKKERKSSTNSIEEIGNSKLHLYEYNKSSVERKGGRSSSYL